ncbi:hypothetical protein [uncultured Tyzzerella sp.]|uniref:DUF6414 family protein n=1 Tax=uncultured Tyzzerella sp. TaxID=2321398 RepID=UPI0029431932|nr:hypothetical protein [uncultured Tyzzerella sp.]
MRNFIYLDTDFLASFMAQENDGLETLRNSESNVYSKDLSGTPTTTQKSSSVLEGNAAMIKGNVTIEKTLESGLDITESSELYREMASKVLHDNMFNYFEKYIEDNNSIKANSLDVSNIGKYININSEYTIINTDIIEKMCEEKFLKDLFYMEHLGGDIRIDKNNKLVNQQGKSIDNVKLPPEIHMLTKMGSKLSYVFKSMIPTNTVFVVDNMIVVINEKYLREDIRMVNFKYSGQINITGKINKVCGTTDNGSKKSASFLIDALNSVNECGIEFIKLLANSNSKNIYIITPIAIYF